jgi:thiol-disulfide isomerase/thioredoxin
MTSANNGFAYWPGSVTAGPGALSMVAALLLLITLGSGFALAAPQIDAAAPSLVTSELGGEIFDLAKLRGQVVLVHYWATWCAPCRKEMPILDSFYRKHHAQGLEVIGISADRPQDIARVRKRSATLSYPTSTIDRISENGFGQPEGFPLTYVIDRDGIVRDKFIDVSEQLLADVLLPLLKR